MTTTATPLDTVRDKLMEMARAEDPYPFLSVVDDYLGRVPEDDPIRAMAVRALAGKGLLSVAVDTARACPSSGRDGEALRAAAGQLADLPPEMQSWSALSGRFDANLAALRGRGPREARLADDILAAADSVRAEMALHRANDGNLLVRGTRSDGLRIWLPAALDFAGSIEVLPEDPSWRGSVIAPFLLEGVGMGWLIGRLHAATHRTYLDYSPVISVVESNLRALAVVFHIHDWRDLLADERVLLFGGLDAQAAWEAAMREDRAIPLPQSVIRLTLWPGQAALDLEGSASMLQVERSARQTDLRRRAEALYAGRDAAFWHDRFAHAGPDDPLRVLCVTSRFSTFLQYSMRDLRAAFERAGLVTRLAIEDRDHTLLAPDALLETVMSFRPDLIVIIDHHRHDHLERFVQQVPFVCWIQDKLPHLFNPEAGRRMTPLDFTMGFGFEECVAHLNYPAERFMPCTLAIDPEHFAPAPGVDDAEASLRCDVAYVSHQSEPPDAFHARLRERAGDEGVMRLMDAFYEETRALMHGEAFNGGHDLNALLEQVETKAGVACVDPATRRNLMDLYIRPLADRTLRHATLRWAADWADATGRALHLYGNGWEAHERFRRYARGAAEHGDHLAAIARQATISLHMGLNPALHQRVLEVLSAGGLVMVRRHPMDAYLPCYDGFLAFLRERGICQPGEIPLSDLPADYVESLRERSAQTGTAMPDRLTITRESLLRQRMWAMLGPRLTHASRAFPGFERVVFDGAASFAERAEWFVTHPDERRALIAGMRQAVNELFSYDAVVARLIPFLTEALGSSSRKDATCGN